jgi:hypothetical protein
MPVYQVVVALSETPSSWLMEGGLVMPDPTPAAEQTWMRELQKQFPGKYDKYISP